jgi:hypothetical protein
MAAAMLPHSEIESRKGEVSVVAHSRSADPLAAAVTSILLPFLRPHGFRRKSNRVLARLSADILQFFELQLSAHGGKEFCVHYAALALFCPRDHWVLQPGDRLRRENGAEAWFPAASHEVADTSMREVTQMARDQALPFLDATRTVEGLLAILEKERWGSQHHLSLEKGCCAAKLGRLDAAQEYLHRAIALYREDGRAWCAEGIERCEQLLAAIRAGAADDLLRQWTTHSIGRLRVQSLV